MYRQTQRTGLPDDGRLERAGRLAPAAAGVPRGIPLEGAWPSASAASRPTVSTRWNCSRRSSSGAAAPRPALRRSVPRGRGRLGGGRPGPVASRPARRPRFDIVPGARQTAEGRRGLIAGPTRRRPCSSSNTPTASARRPIMSRRLVAEFAFAAEVAGRREPVGTWCELNKPQRDHFSFLCNHIEVMFRTGQSELPGRADVPGHRDPRRAHGLARTGRPAGDDTAPALHPLRPGPGVGNVLTTARGPDVMSRPGAGRGPGAGSELLKGLR